MPHNISACGEFLPLAIEQPEDKRTSLSHADSGRGCQVAPKATSAKIYPPLFPPKMSEDPTDLTSGSPSGQPALIMATAF